MRRHPTRSKVVVIAAHAQGVLNCDDAHAHIMFGVKYILAGASRQQQVFSGAFSQEVFGNGSKHSKTCNVFQAIVVYY